MTESTEQVYLRQIAGEQFEIITRRDSEHLHWQAFKVGSKEQYAAGKTDTSTDKEALTEIAWDLFGIVVKESRPTTVTKEIVERSPVDL